MAGDERELWKKKVFNNRVLRLQAIVLLNTTFRPGNSVFNKTIAGRRRTLLLNVKAARKIKKVGFHRHSRWLYIQQQSSSTVVFNKTIAGRRRTLLLYQESIINVSPIWLLQEKTTGKDRKPAKGYLVCRRSIVQLGLEQTWSKEKKPCMHTPVQIENPSKQHVPHNTWSNI